MKTFLLSLLILVVVSAAIIAVAYIALPDSVNSEHYVLYIGWFVFLAFLNWLASMFIFFRIGNNKHDQSLFGILPGANITVFIYSLLSASGVIFHWSAVNFAALPTWHLIPQIIGFAITAVIVTLMFLAVETAKAEISPAVKDEINDVLRILTDAKSLAEEEAKNSIQGVIDFVRYSFGTSPSAHDLETIRAIKKRTWADMPPTHVASELEAIRSNHKLTR